MSGSPKFSQSNGKIEQSVQTTKELVFGRFLGYPRRYTENMDFTIRWINCPFDWDHAKQPKAINISSSCLRSQDSKQALKHSNIEENKHFITTGLAKECPPLNNSVYVRIKKVSNEKHCRWLLDVSSHVNIRRVNVCRCEWWSCRRRDSAQVAVDRQQDVVYKIMLLLPLVTCRKQQVWFPSFGPYKILFVQSCRWVNHSPITANTSFCQIPTSTIRKM